MAQLVQPDPGAAQRDANLRKLIAEAQARYNAWFAAASEEEQMLSLHAQKISMMYGLSDFDSKTTKEEIARHVLTDTFGPKFTERVLGDPKCRFVLGLTTLVPVEATPAWNA